MPLKQRRVPIVRRVPLSTGYRDQGGTTDTRSPAQPLSGITARARPAHKPVRPPRLRTRGLLRRRKAARPSRRLQFSVRPQRSRSRPASSAPPTAPRWPVGPGPGSRRPRAPPAHFGPPGGTARRVGSSRVPAPGCRPGLGSRGPAFRGSAHQPPSQPGAGVSTFPSHLAPWALPMEAAAARSPRDPAPAGPLASPSPTRTSLPPSLHPQTPPASGPGPACRGRASQLPLATSPLAAASHLTGRGGGAEGGSLSTRSGDPFPFPPVSPPRCHSLRRATVWRSRRPLGVFPISLLPVSSLTDRCGYIRWNGATTASPPPQVPPNSGSDSPPPPSCFPRSC